MRNVAYAFVALSLGAMTSSPASAQCYGPECGGPRSGPPSGSQFYFNERPNNSGPREGFDQPPPRRGGPAGEDERRFDRSGNGPPRPQQHGGPPDGPPSYRGAPPDGGRPQYRTESAPPQRSELPRYDGTDRWPPPSSYRRGEPIPPGLERVERGPERRYEQAPGQTQGQAQVTILDRYGVVQQRYSEPRYSEAPRYSGAIALLRAAALLRTFALVRTTASLRAVTLFRTAALSANAALRGAAASRRPAIGAARPHRCGPG